ncbi:hypothetical protein Misp01_01560 [Microtetraspora sp. NBRC 13810]|uniref:WXG100-like domain-containing protein n=1 Tax=Microtetraspora sp. NBRC 13810 TaxID=3030990 RepID=UPI0024A2FBD6|nr:hypothetical protein [Microtetraspora sp. NBRC 13810]GLW05026.1 hypothetical protein Misp01_01560 [Microtetraspora sp. NBRC 13810]
MKAVASFVGRHPLASAGLVGSIGSAAFVTAMLNIRSPEGDPGLLREAADAWDELAATLERIGARADTAAALVWRKNSGAGIEEFRAMWLGTFARRPDDLAAFCRSIAAACRSYAHVVDTVQYVLRVLAVQLWLIMVYSVMWGWATAGISRMVQKRIVERYFRQRAWAAKTFLRMERRKILTKCFYYSLDSIAHAAGGQALQWSVFGATGAQGPDRQRRHGRR